ncbi:MAG: hypothetical protein IKG55_08560 [Solobacterium sp.]|nr:hypothetical protein [Solobacterium sp.]
MNEKTNMILNESLLLWAFGCAVSHDDIAVYMISAVSVFYTVYIYGFEEVRRLLVRSLIAADLGLIIARMSGLSAIIPSAGIVIAANCFYAVMTVKNSYGLMDTAIRCDFGLLLIYTALSFLTPNTQFTFAQLLCLILLIFAPVMLVYAVRVFLDVPEHSSHGRNLSNEIE